MAIVVKDRVKVTSATTGTADFTLGGAPSGFQTFAAIGNNNFTYYAAVDPATGAWEVGYGQYISSGPTLTRNTIFSSSAAGAKISFGSGDKDVFCTYPAEKAIYEELAGNVLIDGGPLTVVGTGVTSYTSFGAALAEMYANETAFAQMYVQNLNNSATASTDIVAYNDLGDGTNNFIDMGIASSNYSDATYPIFTPGSGYLYNDGGELIVGSATDDVVLFAGGVAAADEAVRIDKTSLAVTTTGAVNVGGALDVNGAADIAGAAVFGSTVTLNANPTLALQAATKSYVDNQVTAGIHIHEPVRVETTGNLTATYTQGGTTFNITDITSTTTVTTSVNHGLSVNDQIWLYTSAGNGLSTNTAYFVFSTPALNQLTLSLTFDGAQITGLTNASGLTYATRANSGVGAILTNSGTKAALQLDGVNLSATNRVMVRLQTNGAENGVYVVTTVGTPDPGGTNWVLTRAADASFVSPSDPNGLGTGDYFFTQEGLLNAGDSHVLTTEPNTMIIGYTPLTYTQFSGGIDYVGGTNIDVTGQTISLTGVVAGINGGTGINSINTGDLLIGLTPEFWYTLPIGAPYKSLVVNSIGDLPEWNAVALDQSGAVSGTLPATSGGTDQNAYDVGDMLYSGATNTLAKLAGNITTTKKFLGQTGTGAASAAPVWEQPAASDITGLAASATTDTTNADNITSGVLGGSRLSGDYTGVTGVGTLTAGTWNATAIAANRGGTGITSYAVGDIVYADTTTTLAKLPDVAVGNALISGGVAAAPSWGKIGLATHVDGTLPVANGGTGSTTAFTTGSVVFAGTSGVYSQDNTNFFYDSLNVRLGVGTNSPLVGLEVNSGIMAKPSTTADTATIYAAASDVVTSSTATVISQSGSTATGTTSGISNAGLGVLQFLNTSNSLIDSYPQPLRFATDGTEKLTIESGNGGIFTIKGTAPRITGDFSNATFANRVAFQSSTTNGATVLSVLPNGTATTSGIACFANPDPTNTSYALLADTVGQVSFRAAISGTGTYEPMTFYTGGSERVRIDTSGNVGIGTVTPKNTLDVNGSVTLDPTYATYLVNSYYDSSWKYGANGIAWGIGNNFGGVTNGTTIAVASVNAGGAGAALTWNPAFNIDSSGNVGIGTSSPGAKFHVVGNNNGILTSATAGNATSVYIAGNGNTVGSTSFDLYQDSSSNAVIYQRANAPLITFLNGAERMRIDSSGNVLIGQTGQTWDELLGAKRTTTTGVVAGFYANSGAYTSTVVRAQAENATGTAFYLFEGRGNVGGVKFTVDGAGNGYFAGNMGIGTTPTGTSVLEIKAGTATVSPIKLTAGTNLTTAVAGTVEYDGVRFYGTTDTSSGRGYVPSAQIFRLAANGSAIGPAINNFFGANSAINLAASGAYELEAYLYFTKTTAGTVVITLTTSVAVINLNGTIQSGANAGGTASGGALQISLFASAGTANAFAASGSLTTGVNHAFIVRAVFDSAASASNMRINVTSSAGTVTPLRNSYYKITRLPASNTGSFAA